MIRAGLIDEVFDNFQNRIGDAFSNIGEYVYLGEWIVIAVVAAVAAGFISWFVPLSSIRSVLGYAVTLLFSFVFGMFTMFKHSRGDAQRYRDEIKALKEKKDQRGQSGWW